VSVCVGGCGKVFELSVKLIKDCVKVSSSRGLTIHQHQCVKRVYVCGAPDIFKQVFLFSPKYWWKCIGRILHTYTILYKIAMYMYIHIVCIYCIVCVSKILLRN